MLRESSLLFAPFCRGFNRSSNFERLPRTLKLNNLQNVPGSKKKKKRAGRGVGSGMGKNSRRGHQQSGRTPRGFEGGQTPAWKTLPKLGFYSNLYRDLQVVNLYTLQEYIEMGRLKPSEDRLLTIRDLVISGVVNRPGSGIKLLGRINENVEFTSKIHIEVSFASEEAVEAIEKFGGTVTCVHFNKLSLRALVKPFKFDILPRRARPNPKIMNYYLEETRAGYLSPGIQMRNLQLFGGVSSEVDLRQEHDSKSVRRERESNDRI